MTGTRRKNTVRDNSKTAFKVNQDTELKSNKSKHDHNNTDKARQKLELIFVIFNHGIQSSKMKQLQ